VVGIAGDKLPVEQFSKASELSAVQIPLVNSILRHHIHGNAKAIHMAEHHFPLREFNDTKPIS
jgi:hypothetical protein